MLRHRIEIESKIKNSRLASIKNDCNNYLNTPITNIEHVRFYKIETTHKMEIPYSEVFYDDIIESAYTNDIKYTFEAPPSFIVEITFRPGVTDNPANSAKEALSVIGIDATVASGDLYFLFGNINQNDAQMLAKEMLGNNLIQSIETYTPGEFYNLNRFENIILPTVKIKHSTLVESINLDISDELLDKLSNDRCLALSLEEMKHIRDYYMSPDMIASREKGGLPIWPTDVELELFAQTWSEHCKHKIFSADINYSESEELNDLTKIGNKKIHGLYKSYIKGATKEIENKRKISWMKSVFSDNAGVVRFDKNIDLCIKAETHNSPSALDPYGGALTGILGVNRDILGVGIGAKPIANTDVFCFADPSWPKFDEHDLLPVGIKHPRRILEGVHKGVEDGGNKSGIPTVNGAMYFHQDYAGKPLVFVGTVGVMPQQLNDGREGTEKKISIGDRIVMIGGAIGSDGIHGATFSSMELNENAPATAVQIGDPLTQKRVWYFQIEARDLGLISCVTDNGAGGLGSSIGEMAELSGGATIDLGLCPTKYQGLAPYELMISESQERMSLAIKPENLDAFLSLAKKRGVLATDIGEFTNTGKLIVKYHSETVANIELEFLHTSLHMNLDAHWDGSRKKETWKKVEPPQKINNHQNFIHQSLTKLLASPNIASKENWVRKYDHEVGGATHIKPFVGTTKSGPGNSGVVWLHPHGGELNNAISIGCGLAPKMSPIDTYLMAQFSVDEAIRNVVATGGDPDTCCLLDNFCWPDPIESNKNPDGNYKLGQLVRACHGLYEICTTYGTPLVSGKDSMKNDFRGKNQKGQKLDISILPTLLVTAMAKTDVNQTVTSDFMQAEKSNDVIYLIGEETSGLLGSEFNDFYEIDEKFQKAPTINIHSNILLYRKLHSMIKKRLLNSVHDLSEGGLLVAIAESCFGSNMGADIHVPFNQKDQFADALAYLYNEGPGRFIISVSEQNEDTILNELKGFNHFRIGNVTDSKEIILNFNDSSSKLDTIDLINHWKRGL